MCHAAPHGHGARATDITMTKTRMRAKLTRQEIELLARSTQALGWRRVARMLERMTCQH